MTRPGRPWAELPYWRRPVGATVGSDETFTSEGTRR
jgi:hypothetical protein